MNVATKNALKRIMNNDKEHQFELLVRQHKRTIYTVCYMFSRNKAEIDDLFQEILIRLWNGFDNYEGRSTAQTWIYRVALNTAINQDKKERRRIETVPLTVATPRRSKSANFTTASRASTSSTEASSCFGSKASLTTKSGPSSASRPTTWG